jgi:hypothetical protein
MSLLFYNIYNSLAERKKVSSSKKKRKKTLDTMEINGSIIV